MTCAQAALAGVCAVPATSATKSGPTHLRGPAARADCALRRRRPAVPVATQGQLPVDGDGRLLLMLGVVGFKIVVNLDFLGCQHLE